MAQITRPEVDPGVFITDEADQFGEVLVRLLQLGLAMKSRKRGARLHDIQQIINGVGRLDPAIRASDVFIVGVDLSLAGLKGRNLAHLAEGFRHLSEFLVDGQKAEADRSYGEAALSYGYAAAFLDESTARYSWWVGRLKRRLGRRDAWTWYIRAADSGEQKGEWEYVVRSWLGLAWIAHERTHYRAGLAYASQALRVARDHRQKPLVPEALHYLAVLWFKRNQPDKGFVHARDAVREYGDDRAKIAMLANDVAQFVYSDTGQFARALPLLRVAVREVAHPDDRLHVMASYARAAGGAGEVDELRWVIKQIYPLADLAPEKLGVVGAFKDVARGAISAGLWHEAKSAVEMAYEAASQRAPKDAREIVPIEDELDALQKSVVRKHSKARTDSFAASVEDELIEQVIQTLAAGKMDALVQELLGDNRQRGAKTSLAIDCDLGDVEVVKELVRSAGGTLGVTMRTLNGISVYANNVPVSALAVIVGNPFTQYVTVPEEFRPID
ncbi:tetratricopeptide repeat protein [Longimicrobium terrae]|uniref:Tetratricopeptide (TPR) repeat protein n=1 Tax=Longimicrobium terrae TaxID=1639882 RepID=A0A841H1T1_9BACT|nr:hypothetical protein [Longimicrobium terrae]MBB4637499.1 tetratricopeptide (TPR) repeat protein [Longimicrobium terrae]MBB6071896.1 tetratricopeptide (TPR) repeat protein [Longimicrobium terrae]NNC30446.1 hypothetical protein [Longimicrobium terrae]